MTTPSVSSSEQLLAILQRELRDHFKDGERFWSTRQITGKYGISNSLAQKVTGQLVGMGLLRTKARSGAFVVKPRRTIMQPRQKAIAFVYGEWRNPMGDALHFQVFHAAEPELRRAGYALQYVVLRPDDPDWRKHVRQLQAEGAILSSRLSPEIAEVLRDHLPTVAYRDARHDMDAVVPDYEEGARQAVEHLLLLGHRRIAVLRLPQSFYEQWYRGYELALHEVGVPIDESLVWDMPTAALRLAELAGKRQGVPDAPTAAFLPNDSTAITLIRAAGIAVPEDLSVIGFEDRDALGLMEPPLSTVQIHPERLGREAARLLLKRLTNGADDRPVIHTLPVSLVIRGSTAPPAAQASPVRQEEAT